MIYDFSDKNMNDAKPLRIRFDKIDGFVSVYTGTTIISMMSCQMTTLTILGN